MGSQSKPTAPDARPSEHSRQGWGAHPGWRWAKRLALTAFLLLVALLLVRQACAVAWGDVWQAMRAYPWSVWALAAGLATLSHLIYASFDLIGRHYTGHRLPKAQVMAVTFVSYAFNLNFGTLVGAVGMRARLYTRLGLNAGTVSRIVGLSMLTNWLGYALLAGLLFGFWLPALPEQWRIGRLALHSVGVVMVALALAYVGACAFSRRRQWVVHGQGLELPSGRIAVLQLGLSCCNWAVMGAAMHTFLQPDVDYALALSVILMGAIAGVLSRIPAGLGVLEAVVVAVLQGRAGAPSEHVLLAAVLGYRVAYYWAPLVAATLLYLAMELRVWPAQGSRGTGGAIKLRGSK